MQWNIRASGVEALDPSSGGSSRAEWLPRSCSACWGTLWTSAGETSRSIDKSLGLITIVACLTIFYALIFRLSKRILYQARFQLAVDVLLVTWLVWNSNVIQSPYVALYILIIALSSLFLAPREAIVTSVGCGCLTTCALSRSLAWLERQSHRDWWAGRCRRRFNG